MTTCWTTPVNVKEGETYTFLFSTGPTLVGKVEKVSVRTGAVHVRECGVLASQYIINPTHIVWARRARQ